MKNKKEKEMERRDEVEKIFDTYHMFAGRMISGSKSGYYSQHPKHDVVFNANIFIPSVGKVWFGDLDITLDNKLLQEICNEIGEEMIVVSEMLGRFGAEERKYKEIKVDAHILFTPNSENYQARVYDGYKAITIDKMTIAINKGVDWIKKIVG
jgi:hypothetical protein